MSNPHHLCPSDARIIQVTIKNESSFIAVLVCGGCGRVYEFRPPIASYGYLEAALNEKRIIPHQEAIQIIARTGQMKVTRPRHIVDGLRALRSILDLQGQMERVRSRQGVISYHAR